MESEVCFSHKQIYISQREMLSELTGTDKYKKLYCHSHFMITPKKWVYNMLFWLLVYVTVLLSWFQSNMFQYVVYMRTLIKQHTKQINQPLFGLLTWQSFWRLSKFLHLIWLRTSKSSKFISPVKGKVIRCRISPLSSKSTLKDFTDLCVIIRVVDN